jgi:hypothetical protein
LSQLEAMPGPNSGNTYTCTCTRFCKGYKTGLSRATFYRHAPYRPSPPEFSASFQAFLHAPAGGPSTGNLAVLVDDSHDETFDNEVSGILSLASKFQNLVFIYLDP